MAEFLGLNEQEDGKHIVDPSQAQAELDALYEESVIVKEDGKECVTGRWLESQMLAHGWCPSEVEKVRTQCFGLNALHYVSRLRKIGPRRDHSRCHKLRCLAFQIRMNEYQPAHVDQCRGCDLVGVDLEGMMRILEKTQSFPVLTGRTSRNEVHERDEVQVEAFEPGVPYVAISHV